MANKYQHVKSVLDTGFNELKAMAQNQDGRPQARFQHGDPFKRIKVDLSYALTQFSMVRIQ